jgi:histone H3/H4
MDSGRARPERERDNLLPLDDFSVSRDLDQRLLTDYRAKFSEHAKQATRDAVTKYASNLIQAAFTSFRQAGTDGVSQVDVNAACRQLNRREDEDEKDRKRFWGVVGGICLGTGLSGLTALLAMEQPNHLLIAVTAVLCLAGGFLVAQDAPKTLFRVKRRFGFLRGKARVRQPK